MELKASFDILGLRSDADDAQAKRAYKDQVRRWHPDQFPEGSDTKAGAEERLKQVNIAYARVKAHLAMRRPDPGLAAKSVPPRTRQDAAPHDASDDKSTRRSWFDHLCDTLNAFAGNRADESPKRQAEKSESHRRRTFEQVLDEMTGGSIASQPRHPSGHPAAACRQSAAGYGRRRRGGLGVGAVEGMERKGPVKPVGRVRGIGRSR